VSPKYLVRALLSRDLAELRAMRDANLDKVMAGQGGYLAASTVNGSSFTFANGMTASEVLTIVQQAIDLKEAGICQPITRTSIRFV